MKQNKLHVGNIPKHTYIHTQGRLTSRAAVWTVRELPRWLRSRDGGWWALCFFPFELQGSVEAGLSGLVRQLLRLTFFDPAYCNLTTGIWLPNKHGGRTQYTGRFSCVVQDEEAHKNLWSVKGASGFKACICCRNVVRTPRYRLEGSVYVKHLQDALPSDFALHTPDTFAHMVDELKRAKPLLAPGQFAQKEINYGVNYEPQSILYDPLLSQWLNPVKHTYWDWMHNLVASGGACQVEVNAYCVKLEAEPYCIDLGSLDIFQQSIKWPNGSLPATFFQDRIRRGGWCLKAWAGETIFAVHALVKFAELVLVPSGVLLEETRCLSLISKVLDMLSTPACAVNNVRDLEATLTEHHRLIKQLYGADYVKPKLHYSHHIPGNIENVGDVLSCFSAERKHKFAKSVGQHSSGEHWEYNVMKRQVLDVLSRFDGELKSEWLAGRVVHDNASACLIQQAHGITHIGSAQSSTKMVTEIGELRQNMYILVSTPGGHRLGKICNFVGGRPMLSKEELHCVVWVPLLPSPGGLWAPSALEKCCSATREVVQAIAVARYHDGVKPILPQLPGLNLI